MANPRTARLVGTALRCYPARWRQRHGTDAAELAALLISDGTPARSVAVSYLAGAAREWLAPRTGRRLVTAVCALLVAASALSVPAGLLDAAAPAKAASTSQAHGRARCRPRRPKTVPGSVGAADHSKLNIKKVGHGQSC